MAETLESIIKQLTDIGIIAPGDLEDFIPPKTNPKTGDVLIAELVENRRLTQFQAAQIKAGKTKTLVLGEYVLLDKLGAGGMGQVFKAQHRRMKRLVALKVISPAAMKETSIVRRFQREVEAAARLVHPNIVTAHDASEHHGVHFLVMEFVDGTDLAALVKKRGPLSVDQAINCVCQAARGLAYAHSEGVIHRDIKPA